MYSCERLRRKRETWTVSRRTEWNVTVYCTHQAFSELTPGWSVWWALSPALPPQRWRMAKGQKSLASGLTQPSARVLERGGDDGARAHVSGLMSDGASRRNHPRTPYIKRSSAGMMYRSGRGALSEDSPSRGLSLREMKAPSCQTRVKMRGSHGGQTRPSDHIFIPLHHNVVLLDHSVVGKKYKKIIVIPLVACRWVKNRITIC